MSRYYQKEFLLPSISVIIFGLLYFLNIRIQIQMIQPEILYFEGYSLYSFEDIYPLAVQGSFLFLTTYLFLKQFSTTLISSKNLLFTAISPLIYLLSGLLTNLLLGSVFNLAAKQSQILATIIEYLHTYLLTTIHLVIFFIVINLFVSLLFPKQQHQITTPASTKWAISLFMAFTVVIATNINLSNTAPYLSLLSEDSFAASNSAALLITTLFLTLYTFTFIGYFYFWSSNKIHTVNNIHLDMVISLTLKLILGLLCFLIIWDELHALMMQWGGALFMQDLTFKIPDHQLSYTSNAGISLALYLISFLLIMAIAKIVPNQKYRYFHFAILLILWVCIIFNGIHQAFSLRLILFQSAIFLFLTVLIITTIGLLYTFILGKLLSQYED